MSVSCPYCDGRAALLDGRYVYPHRPDLSKKTFWVCRSCDAYVGCHPGTTTPLGTLADRRLRNLRSKAHAAFDPHWRSGSMRSKEAYAWLADRLGIDVDDCHIAQFDEAQCRRVIEVCG